MVQEIWDARQERRLNLALAGDFSRRLVAAACADVEGHEGYEPAFDVRLTWGLEVLDQTRGGTSYPRASAAAEAVVAFMLRRDDDDLEAGPRFCGKDLSCGMG